MLIVPPVNHSGYSMPPVRSTTCEYGARNSMPRSCTTASQNAPMSATDRARSSSAVVTPSVRISRATLEWSR